MVYQDIGQHISHQFDEDLESLRSKVLNMGGDGGKTSSECVTGLDTR